MDRNLASHCSFFFLLNVYHIQKIKMKEIHTHSSITARASRKQLQGGAGIDGGLQEGYSSSDGEKWMALSEAVGGRWPPRIRALQVLILYRGTLEK